MKTQTLTWLGEILKGSLIPTRGSVAVTMLLVSTMFITFPAASLAAAKATTPVVAFSSAQSTVGSGLQPEAVAVDGAGNVFVGSSQSVVEVPAGCSSSACQITVATGLAPLGVAVDGKDDVFTVDRRSGDVVEVPAGCATSACQITIGTGFNGQSGIAVDGASDVFITDPPNQRVVEVPAGCTTSACQTTVGTGLTQPRGVAVDGAGDVFIIDSTIGLLEVPAGGGAQMTLAGGLQGDAVAVDKAGDVFVLDLESSGTADVVELPSTGTGYGAQTTVASVAISTAPAGLAVDRKGDFFVVDSEARVVEVQTASVNFGNANICPAGQSTPAPCNQTVTLNYNVTSAGNLGTPKVLTQGAPNLDLTLASGSNCTGAVTTGSTCTVNVTFAPQFAGPRSGAAEIVDGSGNVLATTPIYGIGEGPQIAYGPGALTTLPISGLSRPWSAAVDGAGDLFIASRANGTVVEAPAGCTNAACQTTVGSGLGQPVGVAVDGAGDLFIADNDAGVIEVPAECASAACQITISNDGGPNALAIDGAGDLFIAYNNRLVEMPWSRSGYGAPTTLVSEDGLEGLAVDGAGDVFSTNNGEVYELPAGCTSAVCQIDKDLNGSAVTVDEAGDLFATLSGNVTEVPVGCTTEACWITIDVGKVTSLGFAVDAAGDLFVTSDNPDEVLELRRSQAPTLSFATTSVGETSSDSPQSLTIQNIGNQPLTASGLSIGANFAQVSGSGKPEDCTSSFSLTAGASCNLSISFEPTSAGTISSSAVFTDNALNGNPATQTITLSGTGTQDSETITFAALPSVAYGVGTITLAATSNNTNEPVTYGVTGPATISGSTLTITGAGTVSITASQAGDSNYSTATPVTQKLTVNPATLTVTATSVSQPYGRAIPTFAYTITGFVNGDTNSVVSGTATLTTTATKASDPGNYPISFSTPSLTASNYTFTYVPGTLNITQASQTITFSPPTPVTYGVAPIALTATSTSGLPVTFTVLNGPASVTGSTLTITGKGTVTILASVAGNADYLAVPPSYPATIIVVPATPTLTFAVSNQTYGAAPFAVNATPSIPGAITYSVVNGPASISGNIVTVTGDGTVTLQASLTPTNTNYTTATATATFTVTGSPAITVNNGANNLNFGVFPFGLTGTNQITFGVTVKNNSANTTTISAALTNSPSNYTIIQNGCSSAQSGWGSYCQITIGFTQPTTLSGLAQTFTGTLVLTSSNSSFGFAAGSSTVTLNAGSAKVYTTAPSGNSVASPYNFGSANDGSTGQSLTFQIVNPSGWNGSGVPAPVSLNNYNNWNFSGCSGYLADKSSCTATLQFKGSYPPGQTNNGTLSIGNSSGVQVWNSTGSAVFGTLYLTGQTN